MISKEDFDAYADTLETLQQAAEAYVRGRIQAFVHNNPDAGVEVIRNVGIDAMAEAWATFGDYAYDLAAQQVESVGAIKSDYSPYPRPLESSEMAEKAGRVGHYQAGKLTKQNVDGFIQQMAKSAGGQVRRTASMTVAGITGAQPKHSKIRYARVLQGLESCGWCFMLASRGFVYRSEEAASHSHRGCKCVVMAGREGDTIEGYDLEGIQERYNKIARACGVDIFIDKDTRLDQLSREDYDRIARFAELHDPEWLSRGVIPSVDYSHNPKSVYGRLLVDYPQSAADFAPDRIVEKGNEWRDLWVHYALSQAGLPVSTYGDRQIDLKIKKEWWEVKSPQMPSVPPDEKNKLRFIEKAVRECVKQFRTRKIEHPRLVFNPLYRHAASDEEMIRELKKRMIQHGVEEALYIYENGNIELIAP